MIIDVHKYMILGAKEEIDRFFEKAQSYGIIEFISPLTKKPLEAPVEIQHLHSAMRILRKLAVKKPYTKEITLAQAEEIAIHIIHLKEEIERLQEEKRLLNAEILRIAPFGDFSLADIEFIEAAGHLKVQFFCMKTAKSHATNFSDEILYIGSDYDLDYFITFNPVPRTYPDMIEMRIDRSLGDLKEELTSVGQSLHALEVELKSYAGHLDVLKEAYAERLNRFHLALAKKEIAFPFKEGTLFFVEAWIPVNKLHLLYEILGGMAVHCEQILIEETDSVPTYMENQGIPRIGQDLVLIYDVPATTDKDPSGWVFWFFALFFAMIVADGGYGLMYLSLCLYLWFKQPDLKSQQRRFLKLGIILATSCVLWGVATSAFFGISFKPNSWVSEMSLTRYLAIKKAEYHFAVNDDVKQYWVENYPATAQAHNGKEFLDSGVKIIKGKTEYEMLSDFTDNILLELSLLIGVIHISVAFFRYFFRHWAGIGWVAFMIGAYLYCPSMLNATSLVHFLGVCDKPTATALGLQLIYCGIIAALALALVQKRLKGAGEIANLVQVFADVLSYLRLYALGLAGSIMASTFNDIGQGLGLFLGAIVILFGHGVNVLLGIMAGVIHGLRLNFIEWYHYCFDGGGRLFRPLMRLRAKEHL